MSQGLGLDPIPVLNHLSPDRTRLRLRNGPKAQKEFTPPSTLPDHRTKRG